MDLRHALYISKENRRQELESNLETKLLGRRFQQATTNLERVTGIRVSKLLDEKRKCNKITQLQKKGDRPYQKHFITVII